MKFIDEKLRYTSVGHSMFCVIDNYIDEIFNDLHLEEVDEVHECIDIISNFVYGALSISFGDHVNEIVKRFREKHPETNNQIETSIEELYEMFAGCITTKTATFRIMHRMKMRKNEKS